MKPGDIVEKFAGNLDRGKRGVLVEVETNPAGNTLCHVLMKDETVQAWYAEFVRKAAEFLGYSNTAEVS